MKKLGFFFLEFTPCTVLSEHFDASETWHDQIKVKEMEKIITISLQTMLLKPKVSTELAYLF